MAVLTLHGLSTAYPGWRLAPLHLELSHGATLAVLGPSGSGKSTLLRLIAGLERPTAGHIFLEGQDITSWPPHRRGLGLMFQDYALFPHLSVAANIAFGLEIRRLPRAAIQRRVSELLAMMGLQGMEERRVGRLSGGEQQRVALARALAPEPRALLLDEPLAALDQMLRQRLAEELAALLAQASVPTIVVTHDPAEACRLASHLALLHDGQLLRHGPLAEVLHNPGTVAAARLLGLKTIVEKGDLAQRLADHLGHAPAYLVLPDAALTGRGVTVTGHILGQRYDTLGTLVAIHGTTVELFLPPQPPGSTITLHLDPDRIRLLGEMPSVPQLAAHRI